MSGACLSHTLALAQGAARSVVAYQETPLPSTCTLPATGSRAQCISQPDAPTLTAVTLASVNAQVSVRGCAATPVPAPISTHGGVVGQCERGCDLAGRYGWASKYTCSWWWSLARAAERSDPNALRAWRIHTPARGKSTAAVQMFLSSDLYRAQDACQDATERAAGCAPVPLNIYQLQAWRV